MNGAARRWAGPCQTCWAGPEDDLDLDCLCEHGLDQGQDQGPWNGWENGS
jgi:hypothetical protein